MRIHCAITKYLNAHFTSNVFKTKKLLFQLLVLLAALSSSVWCVCGETPGQKIWKTWLQSV